MYRFLLGLVIVVIPSLLFPRWDCLKQAEMDALGRSTRPEKDTLAISPSGHFYIHYDTTGDAAPNLTDLDKKEYNSKDILTLTDNINGLDLTYSSEFDINREIYYDWLSYEVLNQNPNWVFVPFGTGELYKNIIKRNSKEIDKKISSKRFFGNKKILMNCNFMGAANSNKNSKMKMLYSKFQNKTHW